MCTPLVLLNMCILCCRKRAKKPCLFGPEKANRTTQKKVSSSDFLLLLVVSCLNFDHWSVSQPQVPSILFWKFCHSFPQETPNGREEIFDVAVKEETYGILRIMENGQFCLASNSSSLRSNGFSHGSNGLKLKILEQECARDEDILVIQLKQKGQLFGVKRS